MSNPSVTGSATLSLTPAASERNSLGKTLAGWLQARHMSHLGIANTMRLARLTNRIRFRRQDQMRQELYRNQLPALLEENGAPTRPTLQINDGWVVDTSLSLPHLDRVLEDSENLIAERSGTRPSLEDPYRSYFQDLWKDEDTEKYPSVLDFATSSDLVATVADHIKCIPTLSTTLPPGIRFVESNAAYDVQPDKPKDSQLYHIDYYSRPNVYVIVLLRDTTSENGPWTFFPESVSQKAAKALGYWGKKRGYRVSDEEVYSVANRKDAIEFCYPRGTVLFTDSSACFHYGSRNSIKPRFQLMIGYSGACRTDFSEAILTPKVYPIRANDSRLRKLVLSKNTTAI
jgi:hypothetical protein